MARIKRLRSIAGGDAGCHRRAGRTAGSPRRSARPSSPTRLATRCRSSTLADMKPLAEIEDRRQAGRRRHVAGRRHAYLTSPDSKELVVVDAAARKVARPPERGRRPARRRRPPDERPRLRRRLVHAQNLRGRSVGAEGGRPRSRSASRHPASCRHPRRQAVAQRRPGQRRGIDHRRGDEHADRQRCRSASARSASPSMREGKRAYTANVASDDVSVIDIAARQGDRHREGRPSALCGGARRAACLRDQPVREHGKRHRPRRPSRSCKTIDVGDHPEGIEADPGGANVYVACWFDNVLMRIDTATMAVSGEAAVGDGPRAFGLFLR